MNFLSFEYFLAIERVGSIRGAAAELMISQQALSEQIRRLEAELGVKLIASTRPATLTDCGKHFAKYAASMLLQRHQLERELAEMSGNKKKIILSVPSSNCPPILTEVMADFVAEHPECKIIIKERREGAGSAELAEYDLNVSSERLVGDLEQIHVKSHGLEEAHPADMNPEHISLTSNRLSVVASSSLLKKCWGERYDEIRAKAAENPELSLFAAVPFIRIDGQNNTDVDLLMIEKGFAPKIVTSTDTFDLGFSLCCSGVGALFMPDGMVVRKLGPDYDREQLVVTPVGEVFPPLDMIISYQKGRELTALEHAFIAAVIQHMDQAGMADA